MGVIAYLVLCVFIGIFQAFTPVLGLFLIANRLFALLVWISVPSSILVTCFELAAKRHQTAFVGAFNLTNLIIIWLVGRIPSNSQNVQITTMNAHSASTFQLIHDLVLSAISVSGATLATVSIFALGSILWKESTRWRATKWIALILPLGCLLESAARFGTETKPETDLATYLSERGNGLTAYPPSSNFEDGLTKMAGLRQMPPHYWENGFQLSDCTLKGLSDGMWSVACKNEVVGITKEVNQTFVLRSGSILSAIPRELVSTDSILIFGDKSVYVVLPGYSGFFCLPRMYRKGAPIPLKQFSRVIGPGTR